MRRLPFKREEVDKAQAALVKVLGKKEWAPAMRDLRAPDRKRVAAPWGRSRQVGVIYFVSAVGMDLYPIKIGFCASSLEKRIGELQIGSPYELELLASNPGSFAEEQAAHAKLSEHRLCGEWFKRSMDVLHALYAARKGELAAWMTDENFCAVSVHSEKNAFSSG